MENQQQQPANDFGAPAPGSHSAPPDAAPAPFGSQPTEGPEAQERQRTWLLCTVGGLAVLVLIVILARTSTPSATPAMLAGPAIEAPSAELLAAEQERRAVAKAQLLSVKHEADQARELLSRIRQESTLWEKTVEPAMTDDRGKALTFDPPLVERFYMLYSVERPSPADVDAHAQSLAIITERPLQALESGVFYLPDTSTLDQVRKERSWAESKVAELQRNRQAIETILSEAAATGRKGSRTLAEAVAERRRTVAENIAAKIVQEEERARQEAAELEAKARAAKIQAIAKDTTTNIRHETVEKLADSKADRTLGSAEGERERLVKLAKDPAIQAKFLPFLSKGHAVIGTAGNQTYEFAKPASFRLIQHGHALEHHEKFALAGCGRLNMFHNNDRPRWPKPTNDAELEEMRQRFELFKQLAPIWIQMGLLQP